MNMNNLKKAVEFMNIVKFGAYIARQRKARDLPQSKLADMLNVTRQAVSKWERGEGFPDISMLSAIAEIFEISVDNLINAGEISGGAAAVLSSVAKNQELTEEIFSDKSVIADIINLAPYLKVSTLSEIADKLAKHNINISNIIELTEFMNDESIAKLLAKSDLEAPDDELLEKLMPFLDEKSLYTVFERIMKGQNGVGLINFLRSRTSLFPQSLIEAAVLQGVIDLPESD